MTKRTVDWPCARCANDGGFHDRMVLQSQGHSMKMPGLLLVAWCIFVFVGIFTFSPLQTKGANTETIETPFLQFGISVETGRFEVKDKQAQVVWKSNPFHARFGEATINISGKQQRVPLSRCEAKRVEDGLELIFHPLTQKLEAQL